MIWLTPSGIQPVRLIQQRTLSRYRVGTRLLSLAGHYILLLACVNCLETSYCIWFLVSAYDIVHSNTKHVGQLSPQAKSPKQFGLPSRQRLLGIQKCITAWGVLDPWLTQSRLRAGVTAIWPSKLGVSQIRKLIELLIYGINSKLICHFVFATNNLLRSSFSHDVCVVISSPNIESSEID